MNEIRWKQRFDNFSKAFNLLKNSCDKNILLLNDLEQEGFVKRFEFTLELAWKTIKDKMQYDGIIIDKISPKPILKLAFQSNYIDNISIWLNMINDRNLMSHTYDFKKFEVILKNIQEKYLIEIEKLYKNLKNEYRN